MADKVYKTLAKMHYGEVFVNLSGKLYMYVCTLDDGRQIVYNTETKDLSEWFNIEYPYEMHQEVD